MILPFKLIWSSTYAKLKRDCDQLQLRVNNLLSILGDKNKDIIALQEQNKNLLFNYEEVKNQCGAIIRERNKLLHDYNALKKNPNKKNRNNASTRSKKVSKEVC